MEKFIIVLFSIICGALGFLVANFWIRPIIRYKEIKFQITSDLIYYKDAITDRPYVMKDEVNVSRHQKMLERMDANRKRSADLTACYKMLPSFYRKLFLDSRKESPGEACFQIMELSNTLNSEQADKRIAKIQELLKIKPKVV